MAVVAKPMASAVDQDLTVTGLSSGVPNKTASPVTRMITTMRAIRNSLARS